jgi:S-DNA-T family DNA segregation ATPase FtsK/SpoIIIE
MTRGVFPVLLTDFFRLPQSKYRLWTVLSSLGLGITGVFLGFSVIAAFINPEGVLATPGFFFVRSYGILAFLIPVYLLFAAFLLADPQYRPERIFLLGGLMPPFFTLALGFYWIREFETLRMTSRFIGRAGKLGIGFFIVILAALEVLVVFLLRYVLFSGIAARKNGKKKTDARTPGWLSGILPSPKTSFQSLREIYTEAAAGMSGETTTEPVTPKYSGPFASDGTSADILSVEVPVEPAAVETFAETSPEENAGIFGDTDVQLADVPHPEEIDDAEPAVEISGDDETDEPDDDVEKALEEAAAFADTMAAEEAARHGERKTAVEETEIPPEILLRKRRRLPYSVPVEGILKQYPDGEYWIIDDETRDAAHTLKETFKEFNIQVEVTGIRKGPVITMFEILPAPGIRLAKIENLADNIALRLAAQSVRIVAPIPGKHAVGIEVPNAKRNIVSFREIIDGELNRDGKKPEVPVVLGKDITGEAVTVDLVQMPHLLIAGATGSGKSVCVNTMILSILYQKPPSECRLILIDPKIVELKLYNDIPHLLTPVITEPKKAFQALQYCICEMERRYACLDSMGVRDIRSYNRRIKERNIATEHMPYIVVVIDEFADLMATTGKELESTVARLAAMSRAVGIHIVLATQRPSIDVITGLIKANIPSRIAFMVASKMDSRIIIDLVGAEKLLGKGDMLYAGAVDPFPFRLQGAFVSEEEVERVVDYVKSLGEPDYIDEEIFFDDEEDDNDPSLFSDGDDPLYEKALEIVLQQGKASASYIQRRLKIGYNRSARLVEEMERHGVVGPAQGSKPRELLRGV